MIGKGKEDYTGQEVMAAKSALRLAGNVMLCSGVVLSVSSGVFLWAYTEIDSFADVEVLLRNLAIASLGIMYGVAGYLFFLPIRSRLCRKMEE